MNMGNILHSDNTSVDLALHHIASEMKKNYLLKYIFN
jgi:hypothetical protein